MGENRGKKRKKVEAESGGVGQLSQKVLQDEIPVEIRGGGGSPEYQRFKTAPKKDANSGTCTK